MSFAYYGFPEHTYRFSYGEPALAARVLGLLQDAGILDPAPHIVIGEAIAPLRDDGVLIIGSGNSFDNLSTFFDAGAAGSVRFDDWLTEAVTATDAAVRNARLIDWSGAPSPRACRPCEEHLLPLMVVAGAARTDQGRESFVRPRVRRLGNFGVGDGDESDQHQLSSSSRSW
jgi:aromatic ring-opening dioxygenase catalytic subunit (LigB family)